MEPILHIDRIPSSSWKQKCSICKESVGVCIQCSESQCKNYYHISCAQANDYVIEMKSSKKKKLTPHHSYCRKHSLVILLLDKKHSFLKILMFSLFKQIEIKTFKETNFAR